MRGEITDGNCRAMNDPISQFVDSKGGAAALAAALGTTRGAIAQWKFKRKLPRSAWPEILKAFSDVTLDDLLAIERATETSEAA